MRKAFSLLVLLCYLTPTRSQQLYFPSGYYSDSTAFARHLPDLAKQALTLYADANKEAYFGNRYRLEIFSQDYATALKTMDTGARMVFHDTTDVSTYAFYFRIYLKALSAYSLDSSRPFEDVYRGAFSSAYQVLSKRAEAALYNMFQFDVHVYLKNVVNEIFAKQKATGKDSISVGGFLNLCRNWLPYVLAREVETGKAVIKAVDKERYIDDDSVLVKMPDGGTIALDIIRRRDVTTPQPVILMYSIYPGDEYRADKDAAQHGYVGIIANTRGKRLSPDQPEPFEHDAKDAYYIIDWISKQPWCNGKVGMYGGSYLGFAQWSAVKYLHPALKTIVPQVAVGVGVDYPALNGVFMSYMLQWIHYVVNNKNTDLAEFGNDKKWDSLGKNWFKSGRSFRALDTLDGRPNGIFQRWLDHPAYDAYWRNMTPQAAEFAKINIPILTISGYWDADQIGALYYYKEYFRWNKHPNHYLLIGPYDHGGAQGYPSKTLEGYTIDSAADIPIHDIVFAWFDHVLKDSSMPALLSDKVNYEVMGANRWEHVSSFDKMSNDSLTFYLTGGTGKFDRLASTRPTMPGFISQEVDFKDRTGASEGDRAVLDTSLHEEKDLVFVSDALAKDVVFSGSYKTSFLVSTNKKDVDLIIYLYEQRPDGKYFLLNFITQRASFAQDRTTRHLLQPGKVEHIQITNTFLTSVDMPKGSRIIMTVGVNKSPDWQLNYGTGKDVSDETIADAKEPFKLRWYNKSKLIIPIKNPLPLSGYMQTRGGLDQTLRKLRAGEPLTVAFLGGSLTYNPGWRDKVCAYLRTRWPSVEFRFINAGIPSLGSVPHAFRLQRDVLDSGHIDLLFAEAAVNDGTNGTDSLLQVRALEGIVRHALTANPAMNIVMMAFADQDMTGDYDQGKTPVAIFNQEQVATHYHLPSLNIAKEVHDKIREGEFSWEKDFKDVHPAEFGQELYFENIRALLEACASVAHPANVSALPHPLDPANFAHGAYVDVTRAQHDQGWSLQPDWTPADSAGTRPGYVHVPMLVSTTPGASLTLLFSGTVIGFSVVSGPDAGIIRYSIDDGPSRTMDLYTQWSSWLHLPWYEVLGSGLSNGPHVLHLAVSPDKNVRSKGNACRIAHFLCTL
jgi:uncharacterized protein